MLSVPAASMDFWAERLKSFAIDFAQEELFNERRILLNHPSGLEYVLVGAEGDPRVGHPGHGVPPEHAVHGIYGMGIHAYDMDRMVEFVDDVFFKAGRSARPGTWRASVSARMRTATGWSCAGIALMSRARGASRFTPTTTSPGTWTLWTTRRR
ncbi:hypothetical protein [Nesterenkonia pannonica]|uniref:hypothetical protein n=1 Tax=Nesterenkonia pannonica TaxID=1548602 RepID=UPI00216457D9|nr:hypothetical protein [Nesterenkonia pannonica]